MCDVLMFFVLTVTLSAFLFCCAGLIWAACSAVGRLLRRLGW